MSQRIQSTRKSIVAAQLMLSGLIVSFIAGFSGAAFADKVLRADTDAYECIIEPLVTLDLGSETQGLIDELSVDRGDTVKKGDVVALLKSGVELSRVEQASKRAQMKGEVSARKADLELARLVLERAESLHSQELAPPQEFDEARAQHRVAQAALQQAEDNQAQLKLELQLAQSLLAQRIIRSPIDGVVVEQHTHAGEFVHDNPVMTVAQLDPLRVEVVLPLSEFGKFQAGDTALIAPESGGPSIEGIVDLVDPLLDSGSGTFGLRILLDNTQGKLLAGQKCMASLLPGAPDAMADADEQM